MTAASVGSIIRFPSSSLVYPRNQLWFICTFPAWYLNCNPSLTFCDKLSDSCCASEAIMIRSSTPFVSIVLMFSFSKNTPISEHSAFWCILGSYSKKAFPWDNACMFSFLAIIISISIFYIKGINTHINFPFDYYTVTLFHLGLFASDIPTFLLFLTLTSFNFSGLFANPILAFHLPPTEILSIQIMNPILPGEAISNKEFVLDIQIFLNNNTYLNLELQIENERNWPSFALTTSSLRKSEAAFCDLKPSVICSFRISPTYRISYPYRPKLFTIFRNSGQPANASNTLFLLSPRFRRPTQ